jgi:hypothetical protein
MIINDILTQFFIGSFLFLLFIGLFIFLPLYIIGKIRKKNEFEEESHVHFLNIRVPAENEIEIAAAAQLFAGLVGIKKGFWDSLLRGQHRVSFEIIAKKEGIGFFVVVPDDLLSLVEKQINGAYPEAEIDLVDPTAIWDRGLHTLAANIYLRGDTYLPIRSFDELKSDPMNAITSSMTKLNEDEVVALQYIIRPASSLWQKLGKKYIKNSKASGSGENTKGPKTDPALAEGIEKKISKPGFDVVIRAVAISNSELNAKKHLRNLASAFDQFADHKYNQFAHRLHTGYSNLLDDFIKRRIYMREYSVPIIDYKLYKNSFVLNIDELATIFHFPNKNVKTPNIIWLRARRSAAPLSLPEKGLYLGNNIYRNQITPIFLKPKDRSRHMYILGQTGTGKSQFMMSLAIQDIYNGEGLAFIDPHGSDVQEILEKIPPDRADDVIIFDASDTKMPMGLNILEYRDEEEKNMVINSFIGLLYKLYDPNKTGIIGPQLERTVRNIMLTVMTDKEATLVDVLRLLIDTDYSKKFLPNVKDPLVKSYWTDEIAKTSDFHKSEKMGYFVSKFDRFVTEATMRNIIGQPKTALNFEKLMAERKIVLIDLSKGKIGEENAAFLGLIIVPKILSAALARAKMLGKEDFPDFFLYVDEFQNFATPDFTTILSEARKYKLNLIVAHQFISQLNDDIKDAIFGNVGSMSIFRIGTEDAHFMEKQFEPIFNQNDLMNNPIGNAYARLLVDGYPTVPFSLVVDWDRISSTPVDHELAMLIKEKSRHKYGNPVQDVEEFINMRSGFNEEKPDLFDDLPF